MKIIGVMLQRDEIDVVLFSLLHHLQFVGLDRIIVGDNGSTDGSREALLRLERRQPRVHVLDMPGDFDQAARVNAMYQIALDLGADWVVPLDADEFIPLSRQALAALLNNCRDAAVRMDIRHFVQRNTAQRRRMHGLATLLHAAATIGTAADAMHLVNSGEISFLEMVYPPKYIWRADRDLFISKGNHGASADMGEIGQAIALNHVPLRSRDDLLRRQRRIGRLDPGTPETSWHIKRLAGVDLDAEWDRNSSYNGCIRVNGAQRRLGFDPFFLKLFLRHAVTVRQLVQSLSQPSTDGRISLNSAALPQLRPQPCHGE